MSKEKTMFPYKYFVSFWYVKNEIESKGCTIAPFTRKIKSMEDLKLLCDAMKGAFGYEQIVIVNFIRL